MILKNKTYRNVIITSITIIALFSIGYSIQPVSAYEVDTHYHWTFFLALYVGFSWDEAHLIASGDQRMDETGLVAGIPESARHALTANPNNFEWHALNRDNVLKDKRLEDLKQRALDEPDVDMKLVKFGQYLHYLQDMEPHDTYGKLFGHVIPGHAPDSPANNKEKFEITIFNTLDSLNDLLVHLDRPQKVIDKSIILPIIDEVVNQSKPGRFSNSGHAANKVTVENAIKNLENSENLDVPFDIQWDDTRPLIQKVIEGGFNVSHDLDRGEPTKHTWDVDQHHTRSLSVEGIIESTLDGFKFPDGTIQATASAPGGFTLWTQTGNDIYYNTGNIGIGTTEPTRGKLSVDNVPDYTYGLSTKSDSFGRGIEVVTSDFNYESDLGLALQFDFFGVEGNTNSNIQAYKDGKDKPANLILQPIGGNLGIGTTSPGSLLELKGADASYVGGPHIQYVTDQDQYPVMQQLNWKHDNTSLNFDSYYDDSWRSSYSGSNFQISKYGEILRFNYDSGVTAGSTLTWNAGIVLDASGNVGIGTATPNSKFEVSHGYLELATSGGTPPSADCDNSNEIGRMKVDATALSSNLFVCTPNGWATLSP